MKNLYLNAAQFKAECEKCLQCATKPCEKACPAGVSPRDFIAVAKKGDFKTAAKMILKQNPLAETCGLICPDKFCQKACLRTHLDCAINIPKLQAYIMKKYREIAENSAKMMAKRAQKFAVIGSGPAAIGAAAEFLKAGYAVEVFEKSDRLGGALNLIPDMRLPKEIIETEWKKLINSSAVKLHFNQEIKELNALLAQGFLGVIIAIGENKFRKLGIEGENLALNYDEYLSAPQKYATCGNVAIVGGGAVAVDCAITARDLGAKNVEMFVRRRLSDMRITAAERQSLLDDAVDITTMIRVTKIEKHGDMLTAYTCKTRFNAEGKLEDIPNTEVARSDFAHIILALGSYSDNLLPESERVGLAGDCANGSSTAVEAVASGKASAEKLLKSL